MVFAYIRVSTDKQDAENQKIGIVKKSQELGISIDEWIADEGASGTKEYSKRNLGVLMDKINDGDTLIVSEVSRLARSVFMLFRIVEHCIQKKSCVIHAVKEGQTFRKNDIVSAIILSAYGTAAQIEREMIVKRTTEALRRRRNDGVVLGRPVGYCVEPKLEKSHDDIIGYVKQGLSKTAMAKRLGCSRVTLYAYIKSKKIICGRKNKCSLNYMNTNNYELSISRQNVLNRQRSHIVKLIEKGLTTPREICENIKGKGLDTSLSAVRMWFARHPEIYSKAIDKNQAIRKLNNPNNYAVIRVPV